MFMMTLVAFSVISTIAVLNLCNRLPESIYLNKKYSKNGYVQETFNPSIIYFKYSLCSRKQNGKINGKFSNLILPWFR